MRKFAFLLALLIFPNLSLFGQTNSFPATGNVQINSGNLVQTGSYFLSTQSAVKLKDYLLFDSDGDFTGGNYFTIQDHSSGNYLRMGYNFDNDLVIGSNGNVGIGTSLPERKLHLSDNGGTGLIVEGADNSPSTNPFILLKRSRGTLTSPSGILSGNVIGQINIQGRHSSGWDSIRRVLEIKASENWIEGSEGFSWDFYTRPNGTGGAPSLIMRLDESGNVGIGTTNPDQKLTVKGKIHSEEIIVDLNVPGPDYVFEEEYDLPTLKEIEAFIKANKHLPEIPSAKEMETNGIVLGEMNMLLLKKVEELTLYVIMQEKAKDEQQIAIEESRKKEEQLMQNLKAQEETINNQQLTINELIKRIELLESNK